jgi:hypothetical protein
VPAKTKLRSLAELSDLIVLRGFAEPAVFFLEMYKPLGGLCREFMVFLGPLVALFLGQKAATHITDLLSVPANVDELIQLIESRRMRKDNK